MVKNRASKPGYEEIDAKLEDIREELRRFMERSNQQHLELILTSSRKDLSNAIVGHVIEDYKEDLSRNMVKKCDMRETCNARFCGLLEESAGMIRLDKVNESAITQKRSELDAIKKIAPYKQCDRCFSEVSKQLEKQIKLMKSLQIYDQTNGRRHDVMALPEDSIVRDMLEPLSNRSRLQMLKALYTETRTFSALSDITGLRGGNLLFHIQKLLDSGMIIQRHEGGDYMITEKGHKVLTGINEAYSGMEDKTRIDKKASKA